MLFDPAEANHFSPMRIDLYCFPSKLKRQPSRYQNFEAQSHSLFSRCLRLATTITGSHPRLATGGWLDLTRQAFHLLDYSPLSGRTIPIFIFDYKIDVCCLQCIFISSFPIGTQFRNGSTLFMRFIFIHCYSVGTQFRKGTNFYYSVFQNVLNKLQTI